MKGISINGVEYLPASALAKQFRYTTDYIGQLCRANKVEAELVGRSWYVNPESLTNHKKARYTKISLNENNSIIEPETTLSRIDVQPVMTKSTVKMSREIDSNFARRIDWKPLKYESDAGELLPEFNNKVESRRVAVNLADAKEINIKTDSKEILMEAEELPTVSLKGRLKVSSLNDVFDTQENPVSIAEEVPLPPLPMPKKPISRPIHLSLATKSTAKKAFSEVKTTQTPQVTKSSIPLELFIPKSVQKSRVEEENEIEFVEVALLTTTGVLVMSLLMLFFGESTLQADAVSYSWGIDFSVESMTALASLFSY